MPRKSSLINSEARLLEAAREGWWDDAARAQDRLQQLLVGAIATRSGDDVEMIASAFEKAQKTVIYVHDTPSTIDATAYAWMLKACAAIAGLATREMPLKAPNLSLADGTVRERILCTLAEAPGRPITNRDLAVETKAAAATVARILPVLRLEGLIATKSIGAAKLNWLTASGLGEAAKLKAAHPPAPISVEKALQNQTSALEDWSRNLAAMQRDAAWAQESRAVH